MVLSLYLRQNSPPFAWLISENFGPPLRHRYGAWRDRMETWAAEGPSADERPRPRYSVAASTPQRGKCQAEVADLRQWIVATPHGFASVRPKAASYHTEPDQGGWEVGRGSVTLNAHPSPHHNQRCIELRSIFQVSESECAHSPRL